MTLLFVAPELSLSFYKMSGIEPPRTSLHPTRRGNGYQSFSTLVIVGGRGVEWEKGDGVSSKNTTQLPLLSHKPRPGDVDSSAALGHHASWHNATVLLCYLLLLFACHWHIIFLVFCCSPFSKGEEKVPLSNSLNLAALWSMKNQLGKR